MTEYVLGFKQKFLTNKNITIKQALLLHYIHKFISSNEAKLQMYHGQRFYWISTNKVIEDMPILEIEKRQYKRLIQELKEKKLIETKVFKNHTYINIDNFLIEESMFAKEEIVQPEIVSDLSPAEYTYQNGIFLVETTTDNEIRLPIKFLNLKQVEPQNLIQNILKKMEQQNPKGLLLTLCKESFLLKCLTTEKVIFKSIHSRPIALAFAEQFKKALFSALTENASKYF